MMGQMAQSQETLSIPLSVYQTSTSTSNKINGHCSIPNTITLSHRQMAKIIKEIQQLHVKVIVLMQY